MSKISLRSFSRDFKLRLLLRLQAGEPVSALCREFEIAPQLIYDWRKSYQTYGAGRVDALARAKKRIAELERVIGRQQADLHFFREALRLWDATSPNGGAPASTRSSKK